MSVTSLCRRVFIGSMERAHEDKTWLEQPLQVLSRVSSAARGWSGFSAALVEVAGGTSQPVALARHNVTMLVSSPLTTTVRCDDGSATRVQQPGNFDVLPVHSSVTWTDGGYSLFVAVGLEHYFVRETASEMGTDPDCLDVTYRLTCRDPKIEYLLWALKAELEQDQPFGRVYADGLGVALASQLVRRWTSVSQKAPGGGLPPRALKRTFAYIDDRIADDLVLHEIAAQAGLGASRFAELFKRTTGTSVHRYVVRRRVERAVELITRTRLPLCEVALRAGFANQSHMALAVRRSTGMTPKRLRDVC